MMLLLCVALAGCAVLTPSKTPYEPGENGRQGAAKRQEFVESFLQGRWCEAQDLLEQSQEDFLRRDDPCAAAYGQLTMWRLKAYVGLDDAAALKEARHLRDVGLGCPGDSRLAALDGEQYLPAKDKNFRAMLSKGDLGGLLSALGSESDALYASVYARKGAVAALDAGDPQGALPFLELARKLDADRGWVVFLREDWRLRVRTTDDSKEKERIAQRIAILDDLVDTCP